MTTISLINVDQNRNTDKHTIICTAGRDDKGSSAAGILTD